MALNSSLPFSPCPPSQPWVPPDDLYEDYYWKPLVDCMTETPRFSDIVTDDNAWTSRALEPLLDEAPDYRYELWTCVLWLWRLKSLYEQGSDSWYWKKTVWAWMVSTGILRPDSLLIPSSRASASCAS